MIISAEDIVTDFCKIDGDIAIGSVSIPRGMLKFDSTVYFNIKTYQCEFTNDAAFDMLPENFQRCIKGCVVARAMLFLKDEGIDIHTYKLFV